MYIVAVAPPGSGADSRTGASAVPWTRGPVGHRIVDLRGKRVLMTRRPRRVLVAPTAFKGTLGPAAVAAAMVEGVRRVWPGAHVVERPLSDGGNGLLEACQRLEGGRSHEVRVTGPLGDLVDSALLWRGDEVVIESAQACGLHLVPEGRRNPLVATSRGVGELIAAALEAGAVRVLVGLGGSATVDGGAGMARALGWRFVDAEGRALPEGGGALERLATIEPPAEPLKVKVMALCDVENPLTGPRGAARVYGPQKGAGMAEVERLESGLARLAKVIEARLGIRVAGLPGAGAAGGMGAGVRAFLDGELTPGAAWMMERARLYEELEHADLVVTGEGGFDAQSEMGKLTGRVIEAARAVRVPVLLVCGRVEGRPPEGVRALDGGSRRLDERDLADLVEAGCRGLAGGDRL